MVVSLLNSFQCLGSSYCFVGHGEVLWSQGIDHLIKMMPSFINYIENEANAPHVRDGFLMMFIYLPAIFKEQFTSFISQVLPCILKVILYKINFKCLSLVIQANM